MASKYSLIQQMKIKKIITDEQKYLNARRNDQRVEKSDVIKNKKNFTVAVRIKPQLNQNISNCIHVHHQKLPSGQTQLKLNIDSKRYQYAQNNQKKYVFDNIFDIEDHNELIFKYLIQKKLDLLKKGVNLSIMAYGATNSGKTFTIFGKKSQQDSTKQIEGLSMLVFKKAFQILQQQNHLSFSFVQIYNQNVFDLLNADDSFSNNSLNVMQDSEGNTNIMGLKKVNISSTDQLQILINQGNEARISSNNMHNNSSSRSHAFMQMQIKNKITNQKTKLVIVDLAGSQKYIYNQSNITGNSSSILKQGSNINKSLLSLGNCIKSLYQNEQHIPYRDSKLTRLLKQNLSGYAHNIMIACINKKVSNFQQNLNSLNYALKAMKIQKQIIRKIQPQQISQYQCHNCKSKISYALVRQILKHEEHSKRVKTRESQSLSVSPISKNGPESTGFKSKNFKSALTSSYRKIETIIDERFAKLILELSNQKMNSRQIAQTIMAEKQMLKFQIKSKSLPSTSGRKNTTTLQNLDQSINISDFQPKFPHQLIQQNKNYFSIDSKSENQRKIKISLSRHKNKQKQLQKTAQTTNFKLNGSKMFDQNNYAKKYQTNDPIKIQDQSLTNSSGLHSFRSNLTVQIMDDKDKILNERKQVLQQKCINRRRNSTNSDSKTILKFKSTQNTLKTKNVENFCHNKTLQNTFKSIGIKETHKYMKIQDSFQDHIHNQCDKQNKGNLNHGNQNHIFNKFVINQRLLDSTTVAPRMKRDQQEALSFKIMPIRIVQSPQLGNSSEKKQNEQSFVQQKIGYDFRHNLKTMFKY